MFQLFHGTHREWGASIMGDVVSCLRYYNGIRIGLKIVAPVESSVGGPLRGIQRGRPQLNQPMADRKAVPVKWSYGIEQDKYLTPMKWPSDFIGQAG